MQLVLQKNKERERRRRTTKPQIDSGIKAPTFRGANLEIQSYSGNEWMLSGPAETGKTWAALWRLDSLLRTTPRVKATLARKIQSTIYGTVLVTWEAIQELRQSLGYARAVAFGGEKPQWYSYPNGSRLWVGGMDNPNKILSGERDWIYINQAEELTENDWEILLTRTTGRGAVTKTPMLFGDCNPGAEDHWIQKRLSLKVFQSKHKDNPSLYTESGDLTEQGQRTMATLHSLTGIRKKRLLEGLWVGAEGLFFEEFDPEVGGLHVCEPFPIPEDWPIWAALDYGFSHPTAFGLFTEGNDGEIYMIAEHVQNKWLPPAHCKAIRRKVEKAGIAWHRVKNIVAGHDCFQNKGDANAKTIAQQYAEAKDPETGEAIGLNMTKATIDRVSGAQELLTRLGNAEAGITPSLKIFETCKRTISAITRAVVDPLDAEAIKKVNSDVNGEGGDDEVDMLRYGVMTRRRRKWDTA